MAVVWKLICMFAAWVTAYEVIDGNGSTDKYLRRWRVLALPRGIRVYLHHFVGDDWARDPHDHPKTFWSIGLFGSYIEEQSVPCFARCQVKNFWSEDEFPARLTYRARFDAPWFRRFEPHHTHRLMLPDDCDSCWTLVAVGPTRRDWGFWTPGGWVYWRDYVEQKTGKPV